ncbi:hypothetical protein [European catfish virus]|uniref:Uncharacterized protein n=1 Tax=European catfish virus TaxID=84739 RepID=I2BFP6_9VIRU|nr:hypothetical protein A190_gp066 [European catfish virus]AFJ52349.1 hypothetical protein [European catfish virus]AMZ04895.1 hypothetical protein [European catfish virus]AMZ05031.1 hypothetical protein [European catfish virus]
MGPRGAAGVGTATVNVKSAGGDVLVSVCRRSRRRKGQGRARGSHGSRGAGGTDGQVWTGGTGRTGRADGPAWRKGRDGTRR